ncbi:MAG: sodium:proton exchanger [Cycloclasticus sp.]|nr:sodium:proton exchanger [Cycloclasticus sp.]MBG97139.1 sodium:proton exchanger [Cycloclasticus sp.]
MHMEPFMPVLFAIAFVTLVTGMILKRFKQPHVIAYLLVGVILGPSGLAVIADKDWVGQLGSIGVVLLLFFVGMEVSPKRLAANWKLPVIGTLLQIMVSVLFVAIMGYFLDWPFPRIVLLGFVISLSSTAVVIKLLQDWKELDTRIGQDVLGILLIQDLAIVPMMISIGLLGGEEFSPTVLILQLVGGSAIIALAIWVSVKDRIILSWLKKIADDKEMQLFAALGICFGMSFLTGVLQLSTALGAFVSGIVVSSARETEWVYKSLDSLRVIFIALFFLSIGMLIDLSFVQKNIVEVGLLVIAVMVSNTMINAIIIYLFAKEWRPSFYAGAMLSQVGEFSFVLAAIGLNTGIINDYGYQTTIAVIALSLFLSPIFIMVTKHIVSNTLKQDTYS